MINKILEAPVGQVANVLGKVLDGNILLQIIEQSTVSPHHFERKVTISSNQLPVIKAQVKFDSRQLFVARIRKVISRLDDELRKIAPETYSIQQAKRKSVAYFIRTGD
ncbi:MAG: hypothetical protein P8X83_06630 [Nitrosopumilaceae archaeon]